MTNENRFFKRLWIDPVGSKVIAGVILALIAWIGAQFVPKEGKLAQLASALIPAPAWLWACLICLLIALVWLAIRNAKRKPGDAMSSNEWFSEIVRQMADCTAAKIYLRGFAHPDQFRDDHRRDLLKFMQLLRARISNGARIEIVAYHHQTNFKSGLDWLKSELGNDFPGASNIRIIKNQPAANSSSMYLFDSGVMLYNERRSGAYSYHNQNLSGTVVQHFLDLGYTKVWEKCP